MRAWKGRRGVLLVVAIAIAIATGAPSPSYASTSTGAVEPVVLASSASSSTAGFDPGNIIDDGVFFNKDTMTSGDIQSFLASMVPTCQAGYTCLKDFATATASRPADAMCAGAYAGAPRESAAQIVYKVAQSCGINPRVLLVTLQKEQGLVTNASPNADRYKLAMGQGCPDTSGCDANYFGFFNQVYGAAHQFKRYANPPGTSRYFTWFAPGNTWYVRYSPNGTCGSSPVYIQNQATADLYYYTPYQPDAAALSAGLGLGGSCSSYGNRNFYIYFTQWFGSTRHLMRGAILNEWESLGGAQGYLGYPTSDETCGLAQDGCFQLFQSGQIHWTNSAGAHATHGAILGEWAALGYERGYLGYPTSDENCSLVGGGCVQQFQGGDIHWTNATGAHATHGAILGAWAQSGYESGALGYPTTDEQCTNAGCVQVFQNARIAWTNAAGSHVIPAAIAAGWLAAGGPTGSLGYATADVVCDTATSSCTQAFMGGLVVQTPSHSVFAVKAGIAGGWREAGGAAGALGFPSMNEKCGLTSGGCFQYFDGGQVHWSADTGGHATYGIVKEIWGSTGWESGALGYPTSGLTCGTAQLPCEQTFQRGSVVQTAQRTAFIVKAGIKAGWMKVGGLAGRLGAATMNEQCGLTEGGCFQYFVGGQVHWSQASGGHATYGAIKDAWGVSGWETGPLGYPTSEVSCGLVDTGCFQHFQRGDVHYSNSSPAVPTYGTAWAAWAGQGWENGRLGYPVSPQSCTGSTCTQSFEGGRIDWTRGSAAQITYR